jgi:hypothetical protein
MEMSIIKQIEGMTLSKQDEQVERKNIEHGYTTNNQRNNHNGEQQDPA